MGRRMWLEAVGDHVLLMSTTFFGNLESLPLCLFVHKIGQFFNSHSPLSADIFCTYSLWCSDVLDINSLACTLLSLCVGLARAIRLSSLPTTCDAIEMSGISQIPQFPHDTCSSLIHVSMHECRMNVADLLISIKWMTISNTSQSHVICARITYLQNLLFDVSLDGKHRQDGPVY